MLCTFPVSLLMIPKAWSYYKCGILFSDMADTLYLFMLTHTFKVLKKIYINLYKYHVTFDIMNILVHIFSVYLIVTLKTLSENTI